MKAAVLVDINKIEVSEVGLTELKFGQVSVKLLTSSLCGAQLMELYGLKNNKKFMPHLMGHEGCGIVMETGPGVSKVAKGDKVILHWRCGSGIESDFPKYVYQGKEISSGKVTTFNEISIVSENRITKVPNETNNDFCSLLGCCLSTAIGVVENDAKIRFGESVLIIGAGGVGLAIAKVAKFLCPKVLTIVDKNKNKELLAKRNSVDEFFSPYGNCNGTFDVIIDTSGNPFLIQHFLKQLNPSGRFIMVGQPINTITIDNPISLFDGSGKTILASQGGRFNPAADMERYLNFERNIDFSTLITHRYQLEDINAAFELMQSEESFGRIIIE